jgi:hypothetical protein
LAPGGAQRADFIEYLSVGFVPANCPSSAATKVCEWMFAATAHLASSNSRIASLRRDSA